MLLADAEAARAKAAAEAAALAQQRTGLCRRRRPHRRRPRVPRPKPSARPCCARPTGDAATHRAEAQQAIERDRQAMRESLEHAGGRPRGDDCDAAAASACRRRCVNRGLPGRAGRQCLPTTSGALHRCRMPPIEVRSAAPLDAASQAECRDMLTRVLGSAPELSFRTDPTLIAGIELASPHAGLRNSWRADLEQITARAADTMSAMTSHPITWLELARSRVAAARSGPIWLRSAA